MTEQMQETSEETSTSTEVMELPEMNLPDPKMVGTQVQTAFRSIHSKIEEEVKAAPTDMTAAENREFVRSLAYRISRTKTGMDEQAKRLVDGHKQIVDAVNAERRDLREGLDKLRDQCRAPLTKWEEAEEARKAQVDEAFARFESPRTMTACGKTAVECSSEELDKLVALLAAEEFSQEVFHDQIEEITALHESALKTLREMADEARQREAERAELEELRRKQAEAEEKARIEAEEREAKEARRKAEAEEAERKAAEEIQRAAERERAAEEARQKAEAEAAEKLAAAEKARQEAEERAERAREEAEREAAEKAQREAEERARQEAEEKAADEARAKNTEHRRAINKQAYDALLKIDGMSPELAKAVVMAIAQGRVTNVSIRY